MGKRRTWSIIVLAAALAAQASAAPTPEEQVKLDALDAAIDGTILFTKGEKVYKMVIGVWTPVEIGDGAYARWSPDGTRIAVFYRGDVLVMDADGQNREFLVGGVTGSAINPIDFHTNDEEIIFTQYNYGLRAIGIADKVLRAVATYHRYYGEASVSADGRRMAARHEHDLYAIQVGVGDRKFAAGCSPGVCPNGARLMNNTGAHDKLQIRDWDGSNLFEISSSTCQPDDVWDNHHWSNHPDYIAVQGDVDREIYVLQISAAPADQGTRVTWLGNCSYADLYVENVLSISGTITDTGAGAPAANRIVEATDGSETISTQTNELGEYMIIGILAGDYTISAPGYDLTPTDPVTVSGSDVTGADFDATAQDTDSDLLDDPWEYKYFGGVASTDGTGDADGDGKTDRQEYDAGTNPTLAEATPSDGGDDGCGAGGACFALVVMLAAARMLDRCRACVLS